MTLVVQIRATGGPEVLVPAQQDLPRPAAGEVRLRQEAAGLNYVDVYHRTGLYLVPGLPAVIGVEGAGVVEELGAGVEGLAVGDRAAYAGLPVGGYAEARLIPAARLIRLPEAVATRSAAGAMLRGVTAHMLLHRVHALQPGETVLIHAAAGGLGLILAQWAKRLGATVIGTVGSEAKAELARRHGVDHAILYDRTDFVAGAREITGGTGVDYAIDGIGGDTLLRTLDCVRPFGTVASVGQAGGPVPALRVAELGPRRSLALARPSVFAYAADPAAYRMAAKAFLALLQTGLRVEIGAGFPLRDAAQAHRALEARRTTGSSLLLT
ncbi:quinone oxidoreductase [Roseomonas sp. E05]|uniref:quinone oxidoreductase family protein n=1 Tax=Roseomonas sp. E05 TaxID=3046310 RepID=UPI0024B912CE|nr:quinone oxidoreductase [Roseomonas sp. E05]MDJ0388690.1 quinone oxidoreductase [Roseomonas sp. E05]